LVLAIVVVRLGVVMEGPEWNILLFVGEDAQPSSSHPIVNLESSDG
jgi:hypothetical protein